jgi:hypothetical protein
MFAQLPAAVIGQIRQVKELPDTADIVMAATQVVTATTINDIDKFRLFP